MRILEGTTISGFKIEALPQKNSWADLKSWSVASTEKSKVQFNNRVQKDA